MLMRSDRDSRPRWPSSAPRWMVSAGPSRAAVPGLSSRWWRCPHSILTSFGPAQRVCGADDNLALKVCTTSPRWLRVSLLSVTIPRSGRDREGVISMTSLSTCRTSPGRVGLGQAISPPAPTTRSISFAELRSQAEALAGWLQQEGVGKWRPRRPLHAELPAVPDRALRDLACQRGGVPVNPMNRAEEFSHYIADPDTSVIVCTADLAPSSPRARRRCPRRSARARSGHPLHRHHARRPIGEADAPSPAMEAWLRTDAELPPGYVRWSDALAAACVPARTPPRPTTWRCCPTPRARPACPRAACTPIAP